MHLGAVTPGTAFAPGTVGPPGTAGPPGTVGGGAGGVGGNADPGEMDDNPWFFLDPHEKNADSKPSKLVQGDTSKMPSERFTMSNVDLGDEELP